MPVVTEKQRVPPAKPPAKPIAPPATHVISTSGQVAEKVDVGQAAELLRRRDAQAETLRLARAKLERIGRAQGLNSEALAQSDREMKELWERAIEANIVGLKDAARGPDEKSAAVAFPAGRTRNKHVDELLGDIRKVEAAKKLASATDKELHRRVVAARIAVLIEHAALKALAAKYIRAACAERVGAIDLTKMIASEGEVHLRSLRVDEELAIADKLEREVAAFDVKRKELEVLYGKMEGI